VSEIGDGSERVTRYEQAAKNQTQNLDLVAVVDEAVLSGNATAVVGRAEHVDARKAANERVVAADVIGVMVRREDGGETESELVERALDGLGFASVDDGAELRALGANEVGVVVLETRNDRDFHGVRMILGASSSTKQW
jgi:hypothetical protein